MSAQDYTTKFDDLILRCEVRVNSYHAISRYSSELSSDIQRVMCIHSHKIEILEQTSQLAQDIEISLRFSSEHMVIPKIGE